MKSDRSAEVLHHFGLGNLGILANCYTLVTYLLTYLCNGLVSVFSSVRLSICPIVRPPRSIAAGLLLCARRAEISIDCRTTCVQQQRRRSTALLVQQRMRAVSRCQPTQEAERQLVLYIFIRVNMWLAAWRSGQRSSSHEQS